MSQLWIIDDEPVICLALRRAFESQGHAVRVFSAAEPAMIALRSQANSAASKESMPDLLIIDVRLPGIDGLQALQQFRDLIGDIPVIVITAFGDLPTAILAIKANVFDYLTKPFDLDTALTAVERGLASRNSIDANTALVVSDKDPQLNQLDPLELFGNSPKMQIVFKRIALAAMSDCPVLICGESGTGKELVSKSIHQHSARQNEPYLAIAPVALNPTLIESELFGHERGAFTGADLPRRGMFELAGKGTLLLDEIGDLPLAQQVKLLRVLEQRVFLPVGSTKAKVVEARVIAATNRDLSQMVTDGLFREDLYFRLAVFTIELPALRERPGDIIPLALSFLGRHGYPANIDCLASETIEELESHTWPGNVRELRNVMDHAAVLARGNRIYREHLPLLRGDRSKANKLEPESLESRFENLIRTWVAAQQSRQLSASQVRELSNDNRDSAGDEAADASLYAEFMSVVEPPLLRALLESSQGNRAAVAQCLGLHRSTLRQKMRNYRMDP